MVRLTRKMAGTTSSASLVVSPMQWSPPPQQEQVQLSGSTTTSYRGRCLGRKPTLRAADGLHRKPCSPPSGRSSLAATGTVERSPRSKLACAGSIVDQPLKAGDFLLKVGYPGIANQNHPAQLLDILRKLIGWKRHAETYHTGMDLQANTMGSSGFRRSLYGLLLNPCPVQPGNEQIELLRGHADCAVLYRRENELAAFQPLRR